MKKPAEQFGGFVEAGYGKYNQVSERASVDLPVVQDKLLTKFSAYGINDDGYVYNVTTHQKENYQHDWGVRGALEERFSDTARWDFSADQQYENYMNLLNFPGPNGKGRVDYTPQLHCCFGPGLFDPRLANNGMFDKTWTTELISNFAVDLNSTTNLNAITGFHRMHFNNTTDGADGLNSAAPNVLNGILVTAVPGNSTPLANDSIANEFTQELKVNGKAFDNKLEYVSGFYFFYERANSDFATDTVTPAGAATVVADRILLNYTDSYAVYTQGDFHVTDAFKATAGVRYTWEHKNIGFQPQNNPLVHQFAPFSTQDIINNGVPVDLYAKVWTPRFVLNYQINPDLLTYASATRGFKSGGWNGRSNFAQQVTPFGPEYDWTYEAGIKSNWFDNHLRANLNAFYSHDAQFQGAAATVDHVTNLVTFLTANFGTMNDYGLEGEITFVPVERLNLNWDFGIQHSAYANLNPATVAQQQLCLSTQATTKTQCNTGVVTPTGGIGIPVRTPHFNQTLSLTYAQPLSGGFELDPSVSWNYVTSNWVSSSNPPGTLQPSHSLFNAGLTLRNRDQRWSLSAECTNCFNKTFVASFITFQYLNEPGRWTIRAHYDF